MGIASMMHVFQHMLEGEITKTFSIVKIINNRLAFSFLFLVLPQEGHTVVSPVISGTINNTRCCI